MARNRIMMKAFLFEEQYRRDMADLSSGVRLHPKRHRLELMPIGGPAAEGSFPITTDLFARTRLTTPTACRKWRGFFAILKNAKDSSGALLTDVRFRLNDGVDDRYWNAGANAWVVSAPNNWNTEQEVADNIDKWPSQSLQVVINLSTTREDLTPYVQEIRLAYETDLVFLEDYVVRSFIQDLRDNVRPISVLQVKSTGQTSIDLNTLQTPYDVVGVDAVYNDTSDPTHFSPISPVSFDANTKLLSIPAQPVGNTITVRFLWRPDVVLRKSQDFTEIAKIPVIVVDGTELTNERVVRPRPFVINKGTGAGWAFEEGFQADIRLPLLYLTASGRDLHALAEELNRYFANTNLLRVRGQDESYPYQITPTFSDVSVPTQKEVHSARLTVHVMNAVFYPEDAKPITGVLRFSVTGGNTTFEVTT